MKETKIEIIYYTISTSIKNNMNPNTDTSTNVNTPEDQNIVLTSFEVKVETKSGSKGVIHFTKTPTGWKDALVENQYDLELSHLASNEYVHNESPAEIMGWLRNDFYKVHRC